MTVENGEIRIDPGQIRLTRSDAALVIAVVGTSSVVTVNNWFSSPTATTPSASGAARRIVVGDFAIAQSDVEAFFLEQARIGAGAPDAAYEAVFALVWQKLETYTDRFVLDGTPGDDSALKPHPAIIGGVTINGLAGNDTITGTDHADIITGGAGDDVIDAGGGDDQIHFGADAGSSIPSRAARARTGSSPMSTMRSSPSAGPGRGIPDALYRRRSDRRQRQGGCPDSPRLGSTLDLGAVAVTGIAKIVGAAGDETITGSVGDDIIEGGLGDDILAGGGGNDRLVGGGGNDALDGGLGSDTADFTPITAAIDVDLDDQTVSGTTATIASIEHVTGGSGDDMLTGNGGHNLLIGGLGNDVLVGVEGNDVLLGEGGTDILRGGAGDDILVGGGGVDEFYGGEGTDVADYSDRSVGLTLAMTGSAIDGGTETYVDIEGLAGGSGNDTITGAAGNDHLLGGAGNDALLGGDGNDRLEGGAGNDSFTGGAGNDRVVLSGNHAGYTVDTVDRTITDTDLSWRRRSRQLCERIGSVELPEPSRSRSAFREQCAAARLSPACKAAAMPTIRPSPMQIRRNGLHDSGRQSGRSLSTASPSPRPQTGGGALPPGWALTRDKTFSYVSGAAAIGSSVTIRVTASDGQPRSSPTSR